MQSETGKVLCHDVIQERYGVTTVFSLPEVQQRVYQTNLDNHGGKHSQQCEEVLARARLTWLEKYGVDNPSKTEEVKARIKEVWMGKYGVPFPPFPNGLERAVQAMCPACVVYSGDGSYWLRAPGESKARNPDFVVLRPDQVQAYRDGTDLNGLRTWACIEAFGDYWHGPAKTGKDRETHKLEVADYYSRAGIQVLIIWESEVKAHPARVAERLLRFLGSV